MKVTVNRVVRTEPDVLRDFAEKYDLALDITERPSWTGKSPWEASFEGVAIVQSGYPDSRVVGWGNTPKEAVAHYCSLIADKQLVMENGGFFGFGGGLTEVRCPSEWHDTSFEMPAD